MRTLNRGRTGRLQVRRGGGRQRGSRPCRGRHRFGEEDVVEPNRVRTRPVDVRDHERVVPGLQGRRAEEHLVESEQPRSEHRRGVRADDAAIDGVRRRRDAVDVHGSERADDADERAWYSVACGLSYTRIWFEGCSPVKSNVAVIPALSAPCFVPSTSAPPVTTCHPAEYWILESKSSTKVKLFGQPVLDINTAGTAKGQREREAEVYKKEEEK